VPRQYRCTFMMMKLLYSYTARNDMQLYLHDKLQCPYSVFMVDFNSGQQSTYNGRKIEMGDLSPFMAARDMKKTIEFYTGMPGFEMVMAFPTADNPEYVDIIKDGMVLMFVPSKNMGIKTGEKFGTGISLYIQIDGDIDAYYEELKKKGIKPVEDIKDEPFGIRDFTVEDIDGYRLKFNQINAKKCMSCGMPMTKLQKFHMYIDN